MTENKIDIIAKLKGLRTLQPETTTPKQQHQFNVGDHVVGRWLTTDGKRQVQGWCGTVRAILPDGRYTVAFPPYGKAEMVKDCKPSDIEKQTTR